MSLRARIERLERSTSEGSLCSRCRLPRPPADVTTDAGARFVCDVITAAFEERDPPYCRCEPWPVDPVADLAAAIEAGDRSNPRTE